MNRVAVLIIILAGGCSSNPPCPKLYEVQYSPDAKIIIDGKMDEAAWKNAVVATDFSFPWQEETSPTTEFRAICDDERFYFVFRVEDLDIVVEDKFDGEHVVRREDRVELFFTPDPSLNKYYCLEIDPRGRVSDYSASFYRKFERSWNCATLKTVGAIGKGGYVVEGSIDHATFKEVGLPNLLSGDALQVGVFRAEFSHGNSPDPEEAWISWIRPQTAKPDFHVPSAFGCFKMAQ